eukprot:CAMPEP_0183587574 /NCGR_PEP_ID=MMETSP0371-20130417/159227_1 /TAXON_ID=268820 /ORGANISM="Peridinium aciculiferum, Strain PAER-2" /LENGTH=60 /DNA_ID=CAMNT_0025798763 /DNA_START=27 /DNA_END=205 /DNA_ORIENTATION=+
MPAQSRLAEPAAFGSSSTLGSEPISTLDTKPPTDLCNARYIVEPLLAQSTKIRADMAAQT